MEPVEAYHWLTSTLLSDKLPDPTVKQVQLNFKNDYPFLENIRICLQEIIENLQLILLDQIEDKTESEKNDENLPRTLIKLKSKILHYARKF